MAIRMVAPDRAWEYGAKHLLQCIPAKIGRHSPLTPYLEELDPLLPHKLAFAGFHGYWPQIRKPRSFNEKIFHLKYCTDYPEYSMLADKHLVRGFVRKRVGPEILTDVYRITDTPTPSLFDELPEQFVVKPTHRSGDVRMITDQDEYDAVALSTQCCRWVSEGYGSVSGEYWYDDIEPQVMVEEYIDAPGHRAPRDYKFYVFDGRVRTVSVDVNRHDSARLVRTFYDREWNPVDMLMEYPLGDEAAQPSGFERMREIAECLGEGLDAARIDLYNPYSDEVYFGEITLSQGAGRVPLVPRVRDFQLGQYWDVHPPQVDVPMLVAD